MAGVDQQQMHIMSVWNKYQGSQLMQTWGARRCSVAYVQVSYFSTAQKSFTPLSITNCA